MDGVGVVATQLKARKPYTNMKDTRNYRGSALSIARIFGFGVLKIVGFRGVVGHQKLVMLDFFSPQLFHHLLVV